MPVTEVENDASANTGIGAFIKGVAKFEDCDEETFLKIVDMARSAPSAKKYFEKGKRRRWKVAEKLGVIDEIHAGASVSGTARKYNLAPRLLFSWKSKEDEYRKMSDSDRAWHDRVAQ